jgi:molybdenum cofactor guanylyltransferase
MELFTTAVILAGGKSQRMGFDKQLINVKGRKLIEKQISALGEEFDEVILVSNIPQYYLAAKCTVARDEITGMGPLAGIQAGLRHASGKYVYFLACDMPNISMEYIRYMKNSLAENPADACITKLGDWIEPFNAFYSRDLLSCIDSSLKEGKGSIFKLVKEIKCCFIEEKTARHYSPDWSMFLNMNTREDLSRYLKSLDL